MEKKEFYRRSLPHFQQPGQAYFVTWNLKNAVPPKALSRYTQKLDEHKAQIEFHKQQNSSEGIIDDLKLTYNIIRRKYIKAYDDLLHLCDNPAVDLSKPENLMIIKEVLHFWEGKKIENIAYSIMPNHVHWVVGVFEKDENGNSVYLQDIMQSVKRFSANRINKQENRTGQLWQKESFETTIRDNKHLYNATRYTLLNPVSAGLTTDWREWPGCWSDGYAVPGCAGF